MDKTKKLQLAGALALMLLAAFSIYNRYGSQSARYLKEEGRVHGTFYHITYEAPEGKSLQEAYEAGFRTFDLSLSAFNDSSLISRVNRNDTAVEADAYFSTVFNTAREVSEKTGGAFDMTVAPLVNAWGFGFKNNTNVSNADIQRLRQHTGYQKVRMEGNKIVKDDPEVMLDASAIAKGYSSDVVAALLEKNGVENYMVEIGGECVVKGHNDKGQKWTMGITKPVDDSTQSQNELQTIIKIDKGGLATSGNYRRFYYKDGKKYAHTIDPKTGYPVQHSLLSATIYAPNCMEADAYATACMVLGVEKALELIESTPGLEGYFIYTDKDGKYATAETKGFEALKADMR